MTDLLTRKAYCWRWVAGAALLLGGPAVWGQAPLSLTPQTAYLPPPLYVRFAGPPGMHVTAYPGSLKPVTFVAPFQFALRPGYLYRLKISDIPGHPALVLFPTLEVRGSLRGASRVNPREFPVNIVLSEADLARVVSGGLITKVMLLERPDRAIPLASTPGQPLELPATAQQDPVQLASERGVPLLILRLGQRQVSEEELREQGIAGTILTPGEKSLGIPTRPPCLPWTCPSLYDPRYGPDSPWPEMCLPDGGDTGLRVGIEHSGRLVGLDPADTVASYVDSVGRRQLAISNRICLCVPRYLVIRQEVHLLGRYTYRGPSDVESATGGAVQQASTPALMQHQTVQLQAVGSRLSPSTTVALQGTVVHGQVNGLDVMVNINGLKGVSGVCEPQAQAPEKPLLLIKWPDKCGVQVGEIVTFHLKYTNQGGQPIRDVVVSDNLISRFEYVPGSAQSDRPATFTTQANEEGSLLLRWQINQELPPNESGLIHFQVRVR